MFRFDYSRDFLTWALTPPGFIQDWHLAVVFEKTNALVGFISGIPCTTQVYDEYFSIFLLIVVQLRCVRLTFYVFITTLEIRDWLLF